MSPQIEKVAAALANAQRDFKKLRRDRANPFFKSRYAGLDNCIDVTRPALQKHGLVVVQTLGSDAQGHPAVSTLLIHTESGQYIADTVVMMPKDNSPQSVGSAATYARRYGYSAMTGITPDDDDDAEAAQPRGTAQAVSRFPAPQTSNFQRPGQTQMPKQTTIPGTTPGNKE